MTLHIEIPISEIDADMYEKLRNLHAIYEDRICFFRDGVNRRITLKNTNSEELKRFTDYLNKIIKGDKLYQAPVV